MAQNPIIGKIEYGFKDALQWLSASVTDAMAIVYNWEKICTSSDPEVTLHMHDGDHTVMTLSGLRSAVVDWAKSTTGTLIRSKFRAESGSSYHTVGSTYDTKVHSGSNYKDKGVIPYWRSSSAFNEVYDVYCLAYGMDTDRFTSLCLFPHYITLNGQRTKFTAEGTDQLVHKIAIRTIQDKGSYPPGAHSGDPYAIVTDTYLHNPMRSEVVIKFYSGVSGDQYVGLVKIPPKSVAHVLLTEPLGSLVQIWQIS